MNELAVFVSLIVLFAVSTPKLAKITLNRDGLRSSRVLFSRY